MDDTRGGEREETRRFDILPTLPYLIYLKKNATTQHRYSFGVNVRITMVVRSVHQVERSITSQMAGRQGEVFS